MPTGKAVRLEDHGTEVGTFLALKRELVFKSFELTLIPRLGWEDLKSAFLKAGYKIDPIAEQIINKAWERVQPVRREITRRCVIVSAAELGLKGSVSRFEIYCTAFKAGLREIHPQAGWELLIAKGDLHLPIRDLLIGASPIELAPGHSLLFEIRDGQSMDVEAGRGTLHFAEARRWLFEVA